MLFKSKIILLYLIISELFFIINMKKNWKNNFENELYNYIIK